MFSYNIIVKNKRNVTKLPKEQIVDNSHPQFKANILQRAVNGNTLKKDFRVKICKSHRRGKVLQIHYKVEDINWVNNRPMFIEVMFDDGVVQMCHPGQLKRSK